MADRWPFIPDHISNDKQDEGLKGIGIITNEELANLQMAISARLGIPTTIVEFYENKELKTNPYRRYFGHQSCRLLRGATGDKICDEADRKATSLFKDLEKTTLQEDISRRIASTEWPLFSLHQDCLPKTSGMVNNRVYLYYDCPFLGYQENIFPIFFNEKVVAVFITGQICLAGYEKKV